MTQHTLRTAQLLMVPVSQADAPHFARVMAGPDMATYSALPTRPSEMDAFHFINGQVELIASANGFAWSLRQNGEVIGFLRLIFGQQRRERASLSYEIAQPQWGQGLATQAVEAACRHAFATLQIEAIYAQISTAHLASQRVLEKTGFEPLPARAAHAADKRRYRRVKPEQ